MKKVILAFLFAGLSLFLTGCGGGSSEVSTANNLAPTPTPATVTYTIGGTVSGLNGSLTIKNNAVDELTINSSGQFTFATPVAQGGQYNVTITTQPSTQTCTLSDYSGTNVSSNVTSILINCADNPPGSTSLSISSSTLALAADGILGSPSHARTFTITNNGQEPALSIAITANPALPSGTTQSSTCGASLPPFSSCNITITPGSNPSAIAPQAPAPSTLTISGSNTNTLSADVYVLTYGNLYQSGYIFSIDDNTTTTSSIGGKVLAVTDSNITQWSTTRFNNISGTTNSSSSPCNGANDGACDTEQIVNFFSGPSTSFAAGVCRLSTYGSYIDWYLPAICETNAQSSTLLYGITCTSSSDINSKLASQGIGNLVGNYWSATSRDIASAWQVNYTVPGVSATGKDAYNSTRCARALTN